MVCAPSDAKPVKPREAFERLFFDYMSLMPTDRPIIHETEETITWLSKNPCPTLDACLRLGLDTRKVCRAAYEKSTLVFWANVTTIVFRAPIEKTAQLGKTRIMVSAKAMIERSLVMVEIIGGVLDQKYSDLYR